MAYVRCDCYSLAACQRHTPSSLAAVCCLSNNDVISLRSLRCGRCLRCVGWKQRLSPKLPLSEKAQRKWSKYTLRPKFSWTLVGTFSFRFRSANWRSAKGQVNKWSQPVHRAMVTAVVDRVWWVVLYVVVVEVRPVVSVWSVRFDALDIWAAGRPDRAHVWGLIHKTTFRKIFVWSKQSINQSIDQNTFVYRYMSRTNQRRISYELRVTSYDFV